MNKKKTRILNWDDINDNPFRYDLLENRLCQACCPFLIMGWLKSNQLVCNWCHKNKWKATPFD